MRALTVTVLRRLAAEAQLGLVTRAQVTAASATASWLRTQIRVGSLRQLEADVFVLTDSFEGVEYVLKVILGAVRMLAHTG